MCTPQSGLLRDVHGVTQRREEGGRKETEVARRIKGESKGERQIQPVISSLSVLLEKEMATHSSVLAWRIPGMGEPGGLPSMGSHRVEHD